MKVALKDKVFMVRRVGVPGDYGGIVYEDVVDEHPTRATVSPATATEEDENGRSLTETRYKLIVGPEVTLAPAGKLEWRGALWEIHGEPLLSSWNGRPHHWEALLRRRE